MLRPATTFDGIVRATEVQWRNAVQAADEDLKAECLAIYVAIIGARKRLGLPELTLPQPEPGELG